ncbi:hypothetical protein F4780DRAFT_149746 [Xylariomycetidae sp. FL0641]|nr:hypothetical protein F4780DRAFT_149746 [Xylariomycetidae sp. FL0641]
MDWLLFFLHAFSIPVASTLIHRHWAEHVSQRTGRRFSLTFKGSKAVIGGQNFVSKAITGMTPVTSRRKRLNPLGRDVSRQVVASSRRAWRFAGVTIHCGGEKLDGPGHGRDDSVSDEAPRACDLACYSPVKAAQPVGEGNVAKCREDGRVGRKR